MLKSLIYNTIEKEKTKWYTDIQIRLFTGVSYEYK